MYQDIGAVLQRANVVLLGAAGPLIYLGSMPQVRYSPSVKKLLDGVENKLLNGVAKFNQQKSTAAATASAAAAAAA